MKKLICVLLAVLMALGPCALAETSTTAAAKASPVYYEHDGRVTFIDGDVAGGRIASAEDAARVVDSVLDRLGGDARTQLDPWRALTDANGNRYYVFQQMYADTTVLGGAVKVVADADGNMLGLTSSLVSELPDDAVGESIDAAAAEALVVDYAAENEQRTLTVVEGQTRKMILPMLVGDLDMYTEDDSRSRYVWVVYTDSPATGAANASDLPYLAHYVGLDGTYLYSLPTLIPGDAAGASGFDSAYVFEFMEPADYTGYVTLSDGTEKELTVTVMRDKRTGMHYLGNLERRIVVADCYEFIANGNRVVLESSPDNREWDAVGLLSLYNYCKAWDYYKAIGWSGGDGLDTPILVLNDFCDMDGHPVDNACYVGGYLGWQIFAASSANDYSQSLDVIAHEFTHCVTGSVMTYNSYQNDYGAINEGMSDIQGKLCEFLLDEDVTWTLGDHSSAPIRSMSDPNRFQQPAFSWDLFYKPSVKIPTVLNDYGGVHTNSSLLNHVAYRLCENGGMTPEEGRAYWFAVDCAMVPGTDYAQLRELLPWALKLTGLEKYMGELERALDATRLGFSALMETVDGDRTLVTLTLPEGETFDDGNWVLQIFSVDLPGLIDRVKALWDKLMTGEMDDLSPLIDGLLGEGDADALEWLRDYFKGVFYADTGAGGQDGLTIRMICRPGTTVPILFHAALDETDSSVGQIGAAFYMNGRWYDLTGLLAQIDAIDPEDGAKPDPTDDPVFNAFLDDIVDGLGSIRGFEDALDVFATKLVGGETVDLTAPGLENVTLPDHKASLADVADAAASPLAGQKSRPKVDDETLPEAA